MESSRVRITASSHQGLFYGMQSFLQLLPAEIESAGIVENIGWKAPAVNIIDSPRFAYRGIHMDPCRHFMTVEEVKKQIDVLSMFKINTIHWHLTDDQGWRIEIKNIQDWQRLVADVLRVKELNTDPFITHRKRLRILCHMRPNISLLLFRN